jgi:hypothetical protein
MSALPSKADIRPRDPDVCLGSGTDVPADIDRGKRKPILFLASTAFCLGYSFPTAVNGLEGGPHDYDQDLDRC